MTDEVLENQSPTPEKYNVWCRSDLLALTLFTTALLIYFWPLVLAKAALFYFDVTELNYAYRHYFAENLKQGRLAFWCPNLYNGFPLYGESQAGYWHPLKYLFYPFLSTWAAFGYDMVTSLALAGLGTYCWLRRHSTPAGSLAGALVVTFGGFTWAHFVHTSMINALASVPWLVWGLERSWRNGRLGGSVVAGFALACQVFAGHLQDAVFSVQLICLLSGYQLYVHKDFKTRQWLAACGAVAIISGIMLAAVQWIPSYELLKRTPRTEGLGWKNQTFGSWHPQLLPSLFVRESYGTRALDTDWMDGFYPYHEMNTYLGATAMLLALLGARRWHKPWVGMWVFIGFVAAVFMLGRFTFVMDFWYKIPVLGSSRIPVRYHLWATLATAALVSQAFVLLEDDSQKIRLKPPLAILGLFLLLAIGIFAWGMTPWWTQAGRWATAYHRERNNWLTRELCVSSLRCLLLFTASVILIRLSGRCRGELARTFVSFMICVVVGADLIASHWWDMPTVDPSFWTSPPAAVGIVKADPKAARVMGVPRYSAGEPGYASKPIDFVAPRDALGWSLPLAYGLESNIGETPFRPARLIKLTDLAGGEAWRFSIEGVSHLVTGQAMNSIIKPTVAGSAFVYPLPEPAPRFHWAKEVQFITSSNDSSESLAAIEMKKLGARNAGEVLVIESAGNVKENFNPSADKSSNLTQGITLEEYAGDNIRLKLTADQDNWLRLGVSFDPGWHATIDGQPVEIHHAQLAFMAIHVPKGDHELKLHYRPAYFRLGLGITLIGAASATFAMLRIKRRQAEVPAQPLILSPARYALILLILLAISAIGPSPSGGIGLSSRWDDSWHRFTWGAGLEAMGK